MLMGPEQMATKRRHVELSNLDRLSSLPDELLLRIMGFLWTQYAVRTCILSKRWKTLWKSLQSLNFNHHGFKSDKQFIHFVNSFFNHWENTKIDMFRLDWALCTYAKSEPTQTWIQYALTFQPQLISIRILHSLRVTLPDYLFACNSMEEFDLDNNMVLLEEIRSKPIHLPNLKRFNINHVPLTDEFMSKLITGCPRLEELHMKYCYLLTSDVTITSNSLKILSIDSCCNNNGFIFHLHVPSLLSLHVLDADLGDIRVDGMPSLLRACIHSNQIFHSPQESGYELLRALTNVSHLELIGKPYLKMKKI